VSRDAVSRRATATTAAGVALASYSALVRRPPAGRARWERTNYRGSPVTLLGGPAVAAGAVAGAAFAAPGAALVAGGGAAAFGLLDDLTGGTHARGFRGHLAALRRGEVTTGAAKLAGIGAVACVAAGMTRPRRATDVALNAVLVAGCANLVNLLDLRPGRALKVSVLASAALTAMPSAGRGRAVAAAPLGAAAVLLPADLRERTMVGDCGANALGALIGLAAAGGPRVVRAAILSGVVAATVASERVSFSQVIDRTPALAALDRLGRLPVSVG
jgi:hypothetical protein